MPSSRSPAKQRAKTLAKGRTWAEDVLMSLKIPVNVTNVTALRLWAQLENAAPTRHNWLNTTLTMPGATTLPGNPDLMKWVRRGLVTSIGFVAIMAWRTKSLWPIFGGGAAGASMYWMYHIANRDGQKGAGA